MKAIPLTQQRHAIVDDEDYARLSIYRWSCFNRENTSYARARSIDGKTAYVWMHRLVMGAERGTIVDHVNGNGLDNRRSNLRLATAAENQWNRRKQKKGSARFKGVHWDKKRCKWIASIRCNNVVYKLGAFDDQEDAAAAYRTKAYELHGAFANPI